MAPGEAATDVRLAAKEVTARFTLRGDFGGRRIDEHSLEVTLSAGKDVNEMFSLLDAKGLKIASLRNKTNRLEQLFMSRLNGN